jgi:hypothetical protein
MRVNMSKEAFCSDPDQCIADAELLGLCIDIVHEGEVIAQLLPADSLMVDEEMAKELDQEAYALLGWGAPHC